MNRRVGVLGSMVWDRIDHPDGERVERWGGIAYSLAAASAALPAGWTARPIAKLGRDLAGEARAFMDSLPGLELADGLMEVAEPNNRVHLRYRDRHHRQEVLTGGVPPWSWAELEPRVEALDALYVNLISGFELDLATAGRLRGAVGGPVYADLHSLLLDHREDGVRVPRRLDRPDAWLRVFDLVQVNEAELALVAGDHEPEEAARSAVAGELSALFVTQGIGGARWYGTERGSRPWEPRSRVAGATVATGAVPLDEPERRGDPTGCGDVWGATCFMALLAGSDVEAAMAAGNRAASRNVDHRGAESLHEHLRTLS